MAKRCFDLIFALFGLALTWPAFLLISLAVRWEDGGPAFYRQSRVGRHGCLFEIIKFRTMAVGAEKRGPIITVSGDRRITRIGRVLRKTKLDELPQLWNVLRGDMSFVGPRPEVPRYVQLYTPEQREVLALKPGITDEASLTFRDEERLLAQAADAERYYIEFCMPEKIAINLAYARHRGMVRDLGVIFRTVWTIWLH